jgi:hypothetical protein
MQAGKTPARLGLRETRFWSRAIGVAAGGECRGEAPEGGRAPDEERVAARKASADGDVCRCCAEMVGMRLSALRLPSLRMIPSENRTPLFGIMRVAGGESFLVGSESILAWLSS